VILTLCEERREKEKCTQTRYECQCKVSSIDAVDILVVVTVVTIIVYCIVQLHIFSWILCIAFPVATSIQFVKSPRYTDRQTNEHK